MWWTDIINNVVAVIVGLATGFFFERRSTQAAIEERNAAQEQVRQLRIELMGRESLGSKLSSSSHNASHNELADLAHSKAVENQSGIGRITVAELRMMLLNDGYGSKDIDRAFEELIAAGRLKKIDREFRVIQ